MMINCNSQALFDPLDMQAANGSSQMQQMHFAVAGKTKHTSRKKSCQAKPTMYVNQKPCRLKSFPFFLPTLVTLFH